MVWFHANSFAPEFPVYFLRSARSPKTTDVKVNEILLSWLDDRTLYSDLQPSVGAVIWSPFCFFVFFMAQVGGYLLFSRREQRCYGILTFNNNDCFMCSSGAFFFFFRNRKRNKGPGGGNRYAAAVFQCAAGYQFVVPDADRLYCRQGRWIGPSPICIIPDTDQTDQGTTTWANQRKRKKKSRRWFMIFSL